MRSSFRTYAIIAIVALSLTLGFVQLPSAAAQPEAPQAKAKTGQRGGFMGMQADPRVQTRKYFFEDTKEDLEYCVFASSKVSKDKKAPLIVTLHGLGAGPSIMMGKEALDLAEEGGYILVAPMGYNVRGWYGIRMSMSKKPNFAKTPSKPRADSGNAPAGAKAAPKAGPSMFGNADDPSNLNELSEKDVMNVLDIVRKEFNVDDRRIYLMGHSMGGAGTLYLGVKYKSIWAALAPVAPAAFGLNPDSLAEIKDMPVIFIHGDADEVVPVANTRLWVDKAKELNMPYEYNEIPGASHGPVINQSLPSAYAFFAKHSKPSVQ
jgi:predicted peptidase